MPARGGEALVEHLVERIARAERDLRLVKESAAVSERDRALLGRLVRYVADQPTTPVPALARLLLPTLGDWCVVDELVKGEAMRVAVALDAVQARNAALLDGPLDASGDAPIGLARVLRRGRIERLAQLPESVDDGPGGDAVAREAIARLATGPVLVVPVTARGRVVGALTFGRGPDAPEYDEAAQRLAADVAPVVALAFDHQHSVDVGASAAAAKAQFLTMMSHELRTPLNAIAGYAQLLEMGFRGPLNESQRDAVMRIMRGQEHLLELVDAVLTFSRLTSGKLLLETRPVSAATLLDDASAPYVGTFADQGITFHVERCADGTLISADLERALEVLRHLLANALKFTPRGGTVTLGCESGPGVVRFVVADTGRGIPVRQRESIFQPFVQGEKGLTRSVDGSGLGLAVGRELAQLLPSALPRKRAG